MQSKGFKPGSQDSEVYELLSRDQTSSIDLPNGSSTLPVDNEDELVSVRQRSRLPSRHSHEASEEEALDLLSHTPWIHMPKKLRLSRGLGIAIELVAQSTPSLLCAVVGSTMAGVVFDQVQFWPAFVKIEELFILVPVLLNMKGCLEMNLASRLSTSVYHVKGESSDIRRILENWTSCGHAERSLSETSLYCKFR